MRVLWLSDEPPGHNSAGAGIRQAYLLDALTRIASVDLLVGGELTDIDLRAEVGAVFVVPPPMTAARPSSFRRRWSSLVAALGSNPPEVHDVATLRREMSTRLRSLAAEHHYDWIIVEHVGLADLHDDAIHARWGLTFHNVASGTMRQEAALRTGRQRWLLTRQAAQAEAFEQRIIARYDRTFAVSEEDRAMLGPQPVVVPNGVDVAKYPLTPIPADPNIVMVATLGYRPNADGIKWFVDEVLPRVQREIPSARLTLAGRRPLPEILALGERPDVDVLVDVPDVQGPLQSARMTIVPLRLGTGTRLKALESFAAGRPVVGTTIGLAGLGIVADQHALIADGAGDFARAVVRVLEDDELAGRLVGAARELVQDRFDWPKIGAAFVDSFS